jgi:hypothetical protein
MRERAIDEQSGRYRKNNGHGILGGARQADSFVVSAAIVEVLTLITRETMGRVVPVNRWRFAQTS